MSYEQLYFALCRWYQRHPPTSGYCEVHHIVPRHEGGSDDADNLVTLPIIEHIRAHWFLAKAFPTVVNVKTANMLAGTRAGSGNAELCFESAARKRAEKMRFSAISRSKRREALAAGNAEEIYIQVRDLAHKLIKYDRRLKQKKGDLIKSALNWLAAADLLDQAWYFNSRSAPSFPNRLLPFVRSLAGTVPPDFIRDDVPGDFDRFTSKIRGCISREDTARGHLICAERYKALNI